MLNQSRTIIMAANGHEQQFLSILSAYGLTARALNGCYKGSTEPSFAIDIIEANDMRIIMRLAERFKQESILFVNRDDNAELIYIADHKRVTLGKFKQVTRDTALQSEAYTHDPISGEYFLAA